MEWTLFVLAFVGACVVVAATVLAVTLGVAAWLDHSREPHQKSAYLGAEQERHRIANDAWWFSEDAATCELIRDLAFNKYGVSEARDKWRKAKAAKQLSQPETGVGE